MFLNLFVKRDNVNIIIYTHKHFYATRKCCCYSNLCVEEIYAFFFSKTPWQNAFFFSMCEGLEHTWSFSTFNIIDFYCSRGNSTIIQFHIVNICKKYVCCEKKWRDRIFQDQIQYVSEWNDVSLRRCNLIYRNYTDFPNTHVSIPYIYIYAILLFFISC